MPKFWRVPLPAEQSNSRSRQDIYCFPDSPAVFWSNPGSRENLSRPSYLILYELKERWLCLKECFEEIYMLEGSF